MIGFEYEKKRGERITVELGGNIETYAKNFLLIVNNARERKDIFYKVENCFDNRVFVTVEERSAEDLAKWLAGLDCAKVTSREMVNVFQVFPNYLAYKEIYEYNQNGDPIDYEFTISAE